MPHLLRMSEITHIGFVDNGANQEDGEGAFIEIWKRADHHQSGDTKMSKFDRSTLDEAAEKAFAELEEAKKAAEDAAAEAQSAKEAAESALAEAQKSDDDADDVTKGLSEEAQAVLKAEREAAEERIAKAELKAQEAEDIAKAERERRERKEFAEIAKNDMGGLNTEGLGDDLYEARQLMSDEQFERHVTLLKAASEQARTAALFEEVGRAASGTTGGAWEEVQSKAADMVTKGVAPTKEQAIQKVLDADPDLYNRYVAEQAQA